MANLIQIIGDVVANLIQIIGDLVANLIQIIGDVGPAPVAMAISCGYSLTYVLLTESRCLDGDDVNSPPLILLERKEPAGRW